MSASSNQSQHTGTIARMIGPVIDVRFTDRKLPGLQTALTIPLKTVLSRLRLSNTSMNKPCGVLPWSRQKAYGAACLSMIRGLRSRCQWEGDFGESVQCIG
jgi:hypothetical protein